MLSSHHLKNNSNFIDFKKIGILSLFFITYMKFSSYSFEKSKNPNFGRIGITRSMPTRSPLASVKRPLLRRQILESILANANYSLKKKY